MVTNSWRSLLIGVFIILLSIASGRAEVLTGTGFDSFNNGDRPFGWTFTNCNSDADVYTTTNNYGTSSPSIKLDSSTDQILTPSFSSPSQLSFWIKGISTDITSSLLIEEYYSTWTTLTAISPIPTSQVTEWLALTGAATRLRFSYSKSAGNLALDDIAVHKGRYMRVTYLTWTDYGDTGNYGDAVYYEFPGTDGILDTGDDRNLLFDGGRDSTAPCALSKFLDSKIGSGGTIYYMVLSSPGADHYSGLSMAVNRYQVLNYYENCRWPNGDKTAYDTFISDLETEGTNIYYYDAGDYLSGPSTDLGPGWDPNIEARVLCAKAAVPTAGDDDNTWSGVIQIRNGESVMIQGGDAYTAQEDWIVNDDATNSYSGAAADLADTDIYKVHHHGSDTSSGATFLSQMSPEFAVTCVAHKSDSGGHPRGEAMTRINTAGALQYRTDLNHHVEVRCDSSSNFEFTPWMLWSQQTDLLYNSGAANYYAAGDDLHFSPPGLVTGLQVDDAAAACNQGDRPGDPLLGHELPHPHRDLGKRRGVHAHLGRLAARAALSLSRRGSAVAGVGFRPIITRWFRRTASGHCSGQRAGQQHAALHPGR
jgi:beta-lactamase superfamily II metal-dependent hydrolase